jgi:hypothetical protein
VRDYVAWLNGQSVAVGTLSHVESKAREIASTPLMIANEKEAVMRITRGARQMFVKSVVLWRRNPCADTF